MRSRFQGSSYRMSSKIILEFMPPQSPRINLLDLNFDAVDLIISSILHSSYWLPLTYFRTKSCPTAVIPLSQTCKTLREMLLPHLFSNIRWPRKIPWHPGYTVENLDAFAAMTSRLGLSDEPYSFDSDIPATLLPHIRWLIVSCDHVDVLVNYLGYMPSLTRVTFDVKYTPSESVINTLALLPSLTTWDLLQTPLDFFLPSPQFSLTCLKIRLAANHIRVNGGLPVNFATSCGPTGAHSIGDIVWRMGKAASQHSTYLETSKSLLAFNLPSLLQLEIDTSIFPWELLQDTMEWPLRVLTLIGNEPIDLDVPFILKLKGLRLLQDLRLLWSTNSARSGFQAFPKHSVKPESAWDVAVAFPLLHSFTLSNPNPSDSIFTLLPPTVHYISLPITHRPDFIIDIDSSHALGIVQALRRRRHDIFGLQLIVKGLPSLPLINLVASAFPKLQQLELGSADGYNHFSAQDTLLLDTYADAFSPLQCLQTLRIALSFSGTRNDAFHADPDEEHFVALLAARLPDLHEVAFQSVHSIRSTRNSESTLFIAWETYHIIRVGSTVNVQWEDPFR